MLSDKTYKQIYELNVNCTNRQFAPLELFLMASFFLLTVNPDGLNAAPLGASCS